MTRSRGIFFISVIIAALAPLHAQQPTDPDYSLDSIVNGASQAFAPMAPNAIMTVYGKNLAFSTRAATTADLDHGALPVVLDGVRVFVKGVQCGLYFVSPEQINFLIPSDIGAISTTTLPLIVVRQNVAGPTIQVPFRTTAPAFFEYPTNFALAVHLDASLITADAPARAGEIIVLYAGGLGATNPASLPLKLATAAASISVLSKMQIQLDDIPVPHANILYAGLAPGFAGLYQINLTLPDTVPPNPQIRILLGTDASPVTTRLFAR